MLKIFTRIQAEDEIVVPRCVIPNNDNTKSVFVDRNHIPVSKRIYDVSYAELMKIRRKTKTDDETPKVKKMGKK